MYTHTQRRVHADTRAHTHTLSLSLSLSLCLHRQFFPSIHPSISVSISLSISLYLSLSLSLSLALSLPLSLSLPLYMYIYVYMCVCIHTYIHTDIHALYLCVHLTASCICLCCDTARGGKMQRRHRLLCESDFSILRPYMFFANTCAHTALVYMCKYLTMYTHAFTLHRCNIHML